MTIEQAWTIVLEHYHDALPPDLQWRPGTFCRADKYWDRVYDDEDSYIGLKCLACGLINRDGVITHDIPAPALTDAAAMAVAEVAKVSVIWDRLGRYWEAFAANENAISYAVESDRFRDAIILAAAELAQKEAKATPEGQHR